MSTAISVSAWCKLDLRIHLIKSLIGPHEKNNDDVDDNTDVNARANHLHVLISCCFFVFSLAP
jgi:hypothetical protein